MSLFVFILVLPLVFAYIVYLCKCRVCCHY